MARLVAEDSAAEDSAAEEGAELLRLSAQRAFWFGWFAAYPDTRLVK